MIMVAVASLLNLVREIGVLHKLWLSGLVESALLVDSLSHPFAVAL